MAGIPVPAHETNPPSNLNWSTDNIGPLSPPGSNYSQLYDLTSGNAFPPNPTPTATVSATWDGGGSYNGPATVGAGCTTSKVPVTVGFSPAPASGFTNLNLTIQLNYGTGEIP